MPFSVAAAAIGAAGTIGGGLLSSSAASKAGKQQAEQYQKAYEFQKSIYDTGQENLQPYIGTGQNALASLAQLYGLPAPAGTNLPAGNALTAYQAYTQTPFYTFPLQQQEESMNRSGAMRGLTLSGGQLAGIRQLGQGYAASNFQGYIDALGKVANLGQSSATALMQGGNTAAQNAGLSLGNIGNANAAGTVGGANGLKDALGGLPQLVNSAGDLYNKLNSNSTSYNGSGGLYPAGGAPTPYAPPTYQGS